MERVKEVLLLGDGFAATEFVLREGAILSYGSGSAQVLDYDLEIRETLRSGIPACGSNGRIAFGEHEEVHIGDEKGEFSTISVNRRFIDPIEWVGHRIITPHSNGLVGIHCDSLDQIEYLPGSEQNLQGIAWILPSPDQIHFLIAGPELPVVMDLDTPVHEVTPNGEVRRGLMFSQWAPDGKTIASVDPIRKRVVLWMPDGSVLHEIIIPRTPKFVKFAGMDIAIGCEGAIYYHSTEDGSLSWSIDFEHDVSDLVDLGDRIVACSSLGVLVLIVKGNREVIAKDTGTQSRMSIADLDGKWLYTLGEFKMAKWQLN